MLSTYTRLLMLSGMLMMGILNSMLQVMYSSNRQYFYHSTEMNRNRNRI